MSKVITITYEDCFAALYVPSEQKKILVAGKNKNR
jgi:hypothetical protein